MHLFLFTNSAHREVRSVYATSINFPCISTLKYNPWRIFIINEIEEDKNVLVLTVFKVQLIFCSGFKFIVKISFWKVPMKTLKWYVWSSVQAFPMDSDNTCIVLLLLLKSQLMTFSSCCSVFTIYSSISYLWRVERETLIFCSYHSITQFFYSISIRKMHMQLSIYLSINLYIYLSIYISVCLFYLSGVCVYLSIICLPVMVYY